MCLGISEIRNGTEEFSFILFQVFSYNGFMTNTPAGIYHTDNQYVCKLHYKYLHTGISVDVRVSSFTGYSVLCHHT
jgi:hypothetical protein